MKTSSVVIEFSFIVYLFRKICGHPAEKKFLTLSMTLSSIVLARQKYSFGGVR